MGTTLTATTRQDLRTGVYEIRPTGTLDLAGATALRRSVLKMLPEQPRILLLGLDDIGIRDPLNLLVLPALDRRAVLDCGVRLQCYCDPDTDTGRLLRKRVGRLIAVSADRMAALVAGTQAATRSHRAYRHLAAETFSIREARDLTTESCRAWQIPQVSEAAKLIVSELVTNAVRHAQTEMDLVLTHRSRLLHIQVRDTAYAPALFPIEPLVEVIYRTGDDSLGGRGLMLVALLSTACGTTIGATGKTVWATLGVRPD